MEALGVLGDGIEALGGLGIDDGDDGGDGIDGDEVEDGADGGAGMDVLLWLAQAPSASVAASIRLSFKYIAGLPDLSGELDSITYYSPDGMPLSRKVLIIADPKPRIAGNPEPAGPL